MFDRFSFPTSGVSRRTMLGALSRRGGLMALLLQPTLGCAGLVRRAGHGHGQLSGSSSVRGEGRGAGGGEQAPSPGLNTLGRMAIITVVALGLLFVKPPLGFGVIGGMALFQMILLANVTRSMLKMGSGSAIAGAVFGSGAPFDDDDAIEASSSEALPSETQPRGPGALDRPVDGRGGS